MKLNKWMKPGTNEIRFYIDVSFGGSRYASRSMNNLMAGYWLQADANGMVEAMHKGERGAPCKGHDWREVLEFFNAVDVTFADFAARYEAALTKGGNFSEVRYFKAA